MRFLVKTTIDTQIGSELIKSGKMGPAMQEIMGQMKPEAAYFIEENGVRTQILIINIDDASQLPSIAEPWWQTFGGKVEVHPAMVAEDLEKAMRDMGA